MVNNLTDPIDVLARTIWGEARGDGRAGMTAVANVVVNRVNKPGWWGHNIVQVCTAPWQFSCWNEGDPNRAKLLSVNGNDPQFVTALAIADSAVEGTLADITEGADSYFADYIEAPAWAKQATFTTQIGHQLFYKVE